MQCYFCQGNLLPYWAQHSHPIFFTSTGSPQRSLGQRFPCLQTSLYPMKDHSVTAPSDFQHAFRCPALSSRRRSWAGVSCFACSPLNKDSWLPSLERGKGFADSSKHFNIPISFSSTPLSIYVFLILCSVSDSLFFSISRDEPTQP